MERLINKKTSHHKPSPDRRPLPTYEDVMQMTRLEKEILNTPLSEFAPTDIHVGAIILGPDRWQEIHQWAGNTSMQMASAKLDDREPKSSDESVRENGHIDDTVPEDSITRWDRDHDSELNGGKVDYSVKQIPDFYKSTGLPNLTRLNLWKLENRPYYNPAILNRATPQDIARFNCFHFEPHIHRQGYCRRCARRAHTV